MIVEINPANEDFSQQEHRRIPPTLVLDATDDMKITDVEQHTDGTVTVTVLEVVRKGQSTWEALPLALTPTPNEDGLRPAVMIVPPGRETLQALHQAGDAVGSENPHQVVLQRQVEAR